MAKIQYDGSGLKIILNVGIDITGSTVWKIYYQKPISEDTGSWTASQESSTSISYTTLADDIDEYGVWKFQSYVETPIWKLYGAKTKLTVEPVIA